MRIQVIFGILWIFTQAAVGLLVQDPVVCRFTESNQCYVALRQQLHLQMPLEDWFNLQITDKTFTTRTILKYRKTQSNPPTPNIPGWQFVNDNKTLILTSAERSDSGTYTLETFDVNGTSKGIYTLQLNIEAQVSSVKVSYSCLSSGVMKVSCSADGDNLHFSWTPDLNTLPQLENRITALILDKDHDGKVTCSVENHVSRDHITTELHPCPSLLFQDPVVCRFTESNQCYVALGQQLHLQMPLEDGFHLQFRDKTSTNYIILKYRKTQSNPPTPNFPGWQFVNDNKTLILTSAERRDSGTYTLESFDASGYTKVFYSLQLNIEAQVSSVKVSYSCSSSGVMKVSCSADGDNLHFIWASDLNTLPQLENRNSTLILDKDQQRKVTCYVINHVSHDHITTELQPCPGFMVFVSVWLFEAIILLSLLVGALYIYTRHYRKQRITESGSSVNLD